MIKFPTVLAGLALGALLVPASAQDFIPVNTIKYAGSFDVATGTFFPSDVDPDTLVSPGDADTAVLYDNTTTNGFLSTGSGAVATNHHVDWGTLTTTQGQGATMTEIRIGYATNLTAGQGAPSIRLRLYQGTAQASQGTVLFDGIISAGAVSASGSYEGFLVDITGLNVNMADGAIGWSYNSDNPVGASTSATGPLLCGTVGLPSSNAPGTGQNKPGFPTAGAYDRYNEASNAYVSTLVGSTTVLSFVNRLKGRETGAPPSPWQNYGDKSGVTLNGSGSATPGSVDNVITITNNPSGKSVILVAGLSQSDFFSAPIGLHFYAHPWIIQLAPILTDPFSGTVALPAPLDASLVPGTQIFMQAFGQNLANLYKKWSEGLQLTIQ